MSRRVVITGMGWVTPLGIDPLSVWSDLTAGQSGIGPTSRFDASRLPIHIAAEVPRAAQQALLQDLPGELARQPLLQTQFAMAAAVKAARHAGLPEAATDPRRLGVYLGCGEVFPSFQDFTQLVADSLDPLREDAFDMSRFVRQAMAHGDAAYEQQLDPSLTSAVMAGWFDAQGPHGNCTSACASSAQAVGEACQTIRGGDADLMLAGGAHSMIHPFGVTGFHRLGTLTICDDGPRAMRPFDRDRNGFVVGEGGAIFVLEELDHARRRGADIWAEVRGYGMAQDAYRITDIHPQGAGAAACMRRALDDAQVNPEEVDYINAHGTSTVLNDSIETLAIKRAFGSAAYRTWISSSKSMLGHATTAGGAIELAVCVMALRQDAVPPTVNYETPDPQCDLDYVPNTARERHCRHVLSNSFGFGGQNVALVVSRYDG